MLIRTQYKLLCFAVFVAGLCMHSVQIFAQKDSPTRKYAIQDNHYANVTASAIHPSGDYFATADQFGKILLWDSETMVVIRTISPSRINCPVSQMRFIDKGNRLLVSEGFQGSFGGIKERSAYSSVSDGDSIAAYEVWGNSDVVRKPLSFDIFEGSESNNFIIVAYGTHGYVLCGMGDSFSSGILFQYEGSGLVTHVALDPQMKHLLIVEKARDVDQSVPDKLKLISLEEGEAIYERVLQDEIAHGVMLSSQNEFWLVAEDVDHESVRVIEIGINGEERTITNIQTNSRVTNVHSSQRSDGQKIIAIQLSLREPILLSEDLGFIKKSVIVDQWATFTSHLFLPTFDKHLFWLEKSIDQIVPEIVIIEDATLERNVRVGQRSVQRGYFLPNNHWMIEGKYFPSKTRQIFDQPQTYYKCYRAGTLHNRFSKLFLEDYVRLMYDVSINFSRDHTIDFTSGKAVFYGDKDNFDSDGLFRNSESNFYAYNIITDQWEEINWDSEAYDNAVSYADSAGILLVRKYFDQSESSFAILRNGKQPLELGKATRAALSHDGKSVVLNRIEGLLEVVDTECSKTLKKIDHQGHLHDLGAIDNGVYWVSLLVPDTISGYSKEQSLLIEVTSSSEVKVKTFNGIKILSAAYKNDLSAIGTDPGMIILSNDNYVILEYGVTVNALSFNDDASLLMVSLSSGVIDLYRTPELIKIGSMWHPNGHSHNFITTSGGILTNESFGELVIVSEDGKQMPVSDAERIIIDPEKVLELFGDSDPTYLNLLSEAYSIHHQAQSTDNQMKSDSSIVFRSIEFLSDTLDNEFATMKVVVESEYSDLSFQLAVNNVSVQERILEFAEGSDESYYIFQCPVKPGENQILIKAVDNNGSSSASVTRKLKVADTLKSELYLFCVGNSQYENEKFNLKFADKDALDMAYMFGASDPESIASYRNEYYGLRYFVSDALNMRTKEYQEICLYSDLFYSKAELDPLDYSGRYWLGTDYDNKGFIWDFITARRLKIDLPNDSLDYSMVLRYCLPSQGGDYCYLRGSEDQWYTFNFLDGISRLIGKVENEYWLPVDEKYWAYLNCEELDNQVNVSVVFVDPNSSEEFNPFPPFQLKDYYCSVELLAIQDGGKSILFRGIEEIGIAQWDGVVWSIITIPNIGYSYTDTYGFDTANKCVTRFDSDWNDEKGGLNYRYVCYNWEVGSWDSVLFSDASLDISGFNFFTRDLKYVSHAVSKAETKNFILNDEIELISDLIPASFAKVHTSVLVNEKATSTAIKNELEAILQKASSRDQVMIFFAGHGVLGDSLQYYYAPFDMDFSSPKENGISYQQLLTALAETKALRKLLILDSCHSGSVYQFDRTSNEQIFVKHQDSGRGGSMVESDRSSDRSLQEVLELVFSYSDQRTGITVMAAASGRDIAYESRDMSNGALTTAIKDLIKVKNFGSFYIIPEAKSQPIQFDQEAIYYLQKRVFELTNGAQFPSVREFNAKAGLFLW